MPRSPQFKISAIRDLFTQLDYAPLETRMRILRAAEELIEEIDSERIYPQEFVTFRITGYRNQQADTEESNMLVGEPLLSDLATFIQLMSRGLALPPICEERGRAQSVDEAADTLNVSSRTLRRYHKRGLLFHFVAPASQRSTDREKLAVYERSLQRFQHREPQLIERATTFSRVTEDDEKRYIEEAIALYEQYQLSRQSIAKRLARRHDRAVETMRSLLMRHEEEAKTRGDREVLFKGRRRSDDREIRLAVRAWERGLSPTDVAAHIDRTRVTVERLVNRFRRDRLQALNLEWVELPTLALPESNEILLSPDHVRSNLRPTSAELDAIEILQTLRKSPPVEPAAINARIAAFNYLLRQVEHDAHSIGHYPSNDQLDELETQLRWAAMLKRTLVFDVLPKAIVRIDQQLTRPLEQQSATRIVDFFDLAIGQISRVIDEIDISREQKLEPLSLFAIDRAIASSDSKLTALFERAGARHRLGSVPMGHGFRSLLPWQSWVEMPVRFSDRLPRLNDSLRKMITARYGLDGNRPMTVAQLAESFELSKRATRKALRQATRELRQLPEQAS